MSAASSVAARVVEIAHGARDLRAFLAGALEAIAPLGWDVALLEAKSDAATEARGFDAVVLGRARARWPVYVRELAEVTRVAEREGVAVDQEVLGARRERLAYFQELVRPHGGSASLVAHLAVGGRGVGGLVLGRCGGAFGRRDVEAARLLVGPLSVGLAARAFARPVDGALPAVTPRENEVLDLLCLGYTNGEIGRALGTSANTVRNQVASLFAKLGATTRAELVALRTRG